ncbi:MAG TPA: protein jag [Cyanobacteria bacterium UBA8530]|nr:protein jag [Cyanobacteria bacterium UBA8530]
MEYLEHTGRNYNEAVAEALEILQRPLEEVEITILEEGGGGLFGLLGSKFVKIGVKVKPGVIEHAAAWLKDLVGQIGIEAEVAVTRNEEEVVLDIKTEDSGILIGRKGSTLDALQYLANIAFSTLVGKKIVVDAAEYRLRRREKLFEQAQNAADRVRLTGQSLRLPPMSASDRRIIHTSLQECPDLATISQGEDPYRYVVVEPRRNVPQAPRTQRAQRPVG